MMVVAGSLAVVTACGGDGGTSVSRATYVAALTGARELPPVVTPASGSATFALAGRTITYTVTSAGFVTPLTVGHVHLGAAGVTGPVLVPFTITAPSGAVAAGSIDLSAPITFGNITISGDSLLALFETGKAYVNLHTAAYPGGEVRGQVVRQ